MAWLTWLVLFKITVSVFVLVIPFLFFSKEKLEQIMHIKTDSKLLFRLYGVAIVALLVAYASAIPMAEITIFPWWIVFMGVVSNCGASVCMWLASDGSPNYKLIGLFGGIGIGFILSAMNPALALS